MNSGSQFHVKLDRSQSRLTVEALAIHHSIHGKKYIQKLPSAVKSATSEVSCAGLVQCNTASKQDSVNHIIPQVIINKLLAYTRFYRNRSTPAAIVQMITNFFSSNEIAAAKKC